MIGDGHVRTSRIVFFAYAVVIASLTHWPGLQVPKAGLQRSDMIVHIGVFGAWALLMIRCSWFGPMLSARNIAFAAMCAVAYAGVDEVTQAFPALNRYAAWDDFAANTIGISVGVATACGLGALHDPTGGSR